MKGITCLAIAFCLACGQQKSTEILRNEIVEAERAFAKMAAQEGVATAFEAFADSNVVLLRGDKLIKGKDGMAAYFAAGTLQDVKLSWEPEFVDVAAAGDMAYTYGPYTFSARDTTGTQVAASGYFHTVWKRQPDGAWKFVWD